MVDDVAQVLVVVQIDHGSVTACIHQQHSRSESSLLLQQRLMNERGVRRRTGHEQTVDGEKVSLAPRRERDRPTQASLPAHQRTTDTSERQSRRVRRGRDIETEERQGVRLQRKMILEPSLGLAVLTRRAEPHLRSHTHVQPRMDHETSA
jgi:hypothetical protein